jgi:hypothetical protein
LAPKSSGHVRPDFVRVLTGIRRIFLGAVIASH